MLSAGDSAGIFALTVAFGALARRTTVNDEITIRAQ